MIERAQCQTLAWRSTTPLGSEVEPEVNWTIAASPTATVGAGVPGTELSRTALSRTAGPASAARAGPMRSTMRCETTRCESSAVPTIRARHVT